MESLSMRHLISATQNSFLTRYPSTPVRMARIRTHLRHFRFVLCSKKSAFQECKHCGQQSGLATSTSLSFSSIMMRRRPQDPSCSLLLFSSILINTRCSIFTYCTRFECIKNLKNLQASGGALGSFNSHAHFQLGYAKPTRLLVATEPEVCTDSYVGKLFNSFQVRGSECLYKVKLLTSSMYGSGLSDLNAGILLCLIDENGDSILQRIPTSLIKEHYNQFEDNVVSDVLHFQRGSVDEFAFEGPKLGKIEALWISLESGQWRLRGVSLISTYRCQLTLEQNGREEVQYTGYEYKFEIEDTLLGEGSDISMVELRPCQITEFSGDNLSLLNNYLLQPASVVSDGISEEESMREYADLKYSLLLYDALLILAGSSIAAFSAGENAAVAFLTGGIGGFLYLFLLQRSVDGLPAPASTSISRTRNFGQIFGGFKGSVSTLAVAFIFVVIAVKYGLGDGAVELSPKELMFGMLGFLACKVAVFLAAFKPMPIGLEENK